MNCKIYIWLIPRTKVHYEDIQTFVPDLLQVEN